MESTRINARAIIRKDDTVLMCKIAGKGNFFFPGGGVEFKEGVVAALRRELMEELGVNAINASFIGGVENLFDQDGQPYHELNIFFTATIDNHSAESKEIGHLSFAWMPIANLERENILPKHLVTTVVQWLKDGKTFWAGLE